MPNTQNPIGATGIEIRQWVRRGESMMVNTEALDPDDPDHIYNQILNQGARPEDYGYVHPYTEEFANYSRSELIAKITSLRKEVVELHRHLS